MSSRIVRVTADDREFEDAMAVRIAVFVDEQGVPEDIERDEYENESEHFVAYDADGRAVGTTRLREKDGAAKIERVAVLQDARREGWGARLMAVTEDRARARGFDVALLHAQTHVAAFYRDLGYRRVGDEFDEAGISHVEMEKEL
jgi:predicted GNAT family N-acyltransferase